MTITVFSPEKLITSFPYGMIQKITPETDYESLVTMRDAMKENYASITSRRGGGTYRYLGGLLSDAVYRSIVTGNTFLTPPDPGPVIPLAGSTKINSGNLNRDHSEVCREHKKWVNLERVGKNQITESVSKTFLDGSFDWNRGFAHIRGKLSHIFLQSTVR